MPKKQCQIHCLPEMADPVSPVEILWQRRNRVKRIFNRRWHYALNMMSALIDNRERKPLTVSQKVESDALAPGDLVRVRSKAEIGSTLDRWNQLNRCAFMEEMSPYCETTQRVFRRVERFLDERDYILKKCKGIVTLEGVFCQGTKDFGPCDRSCFFFWREEWLEKLKTES